MISPARYLTVVAAFMLTYLISTILLSELVFRDRFFACDGALSERSAAALMSGRTIAFEWKRFFRQMHRAGCHFPLDDRSDIVAFGSSRTMAIRGSSFPNRSFYNVSVYQRG